MKNGRICARRTMSLLYIPERQKSQRKGTKNEASGSAERRICGKIFPSSWATTPRRRKTSMSVQRVSRSTCIRNVARRREQINAGAALHSLFGRATTFSPALSEPSYITRSSSSLLSCISGVDIFSRLNELLQVIATIGVKVTLSNSIQTFWLRRWSVKF